jgi:putative Mg2+ transporter-C (MgtC) family protein
MNLTQDTLGIVLSVIFGTAVGLERELSGKAAGLRTNILICVGSAVFTILSREMAAGADSLTRIAAGIVTGIGFLGAGAIIQDRHSIHGLTSAATIWVVAAIGMACGAEYYGLAGVTTLIAIIVLMVLKAVEKPLARYGKKYRSEELPDKKN